MKQFIACFSVSILSTISLSQKWKNIEIEPFVNPLFLTLTDLENQVVTIDERHCSFSSVNRPSSELGFNLNYKFKKRILVGLGISWWRRNYEFTTSIDQEFVQEFYLRNFERELNFNCRSLRLFAGYEFNFGSRIKIEYVRTASTRVRHNAQDDLSFGSISFLQGFNYEYTERFNNEYFTSAIGLNFSHLIANNLRLQVGANFPWRTGVLVYSTFVEGQTNSRSPKTTFLDLKIGSRPEQFFYTGLTYLISYKK